MVPLPDIFIGCQLGDIIYTLFEDIKVIMIGILKPRLAGTLYVDARDEGLRYSESEGDSPIGPTPLSTPGMITSKTSTGGTTTVIHHQRDHETGDVNIVVDQSAEHMNENKHSQALPMVKKDLDNDLDDMEPSDSDSFFGSASASKNKSTGDKTKTKKTLSVQTRRVSTAETHVSYIGTEGAQSAHIESPQATGNRDTFDNGNANNNDEKTGSPVIKTHSVRINPNASISSARSEVVSESGRSEDVSGCSTSYSYSYYSEDGTPS